ncbi:hypothetical protein ACFQS7_22295 [Dankookia sp. GCM10030260]|uniref:hypothetical protein n=1 Tax=Dankookia sp. GCM10030260 TaxID=3273390 RepID=UPI00361A0CB1
MAAEVVVVVEDEDARPGPGRAPEGGRREAADAGADDDEVVRVVAGLGRAGRLALGQRMRRVEAARLAAAQPCSSGG